LLDKIKPYKVIFFFIESYNHVALNVACKQRNIITYHLEHGVRDFERSTLIEKLGRAEIKKNNLNKIISAVPIIYTKYKTRSFFLTTIKRTEGDAKKFLLDYFRIRSKNSIHHTFELITSEYGVADTYISFSPEIFKAHQIADHLG